jgi:hypothetical protein
MKKTIFFLALTCIFMASCNEELFTEDIDSQSKINLLEKSDPYLNGKAVTRTFKIHRSIGASVVNLETWQVLVQGAGNATFLGNFEVYYTFTMNQPRTMFGHMMAANGDQIDIMYDCENYMPPFKQAVDSDIITAYYIIVGGTGRFKGAKGTIVMYGTSSLTTGAFDLQGEGEITF